MGLFTDPREESAQYAKYLNDDYQKNFLNSIEQTGNSRAAGDESLLRMSEVARAQEQDRATEESLKNQIYDGSDTWWNPDNKSYYSRKKNARIYTSGQYEAAVRQSHSELDRIQKDYGLNREDLEYGRRLVDAESRLKLDPQNQDLLRELDDAKRGLGILGQKEAAFRRMQADEAKSGDRGFMANLGSFLSGGGWKQESGFDNAWKHYDDPILREGNFQEYADDQMEDAVDENGIARSFRKHGSNPTSIVPFAHYIPYKSRYVREAAIRLSSHRNPGGQDLYLLAARGDQVKADELRMRDERIMRSWKNEKEGDFARGGGTMAERVSDIVLDMAPYAGEIAVAGLASGAGLKAVGLGSAKGLGGATGAAGGVEILSSAGARQTVNLMKNLGWIKTAHGAGKVYRGARVIGDIVAAPIINAPAVLMSAAGMADQAAVEQSVFEDENGGWHYDDSKLDGATLTRNAMIQSAAELASEFSGGLIGKAFGKVGKGLSKIPLAGRAVSGAGKLKNAIEKYIPAGARQMMKKIRFDGTLEELGEEYLNNLAVYAAAAETVGAKSPDDFADRMAAMVKQSVEDTPSMLLGFAVLPGMALMVNASQTGMERLRNKRNLDKLTKAFDESAKAAKWREALDDEHRRSGMPEQAYSDQDAAGAATETSVAEPEGEAAAGMPETRIHGPTPTGTDEHGLGAEGEMMGEAADVGTETADANLNGPDRLDGLDGQPREPMDRAEMPEGGKERELLSDGSDGSDERGRQAEKREAGNVESIPISELNIDPARFQFKSKADKITGVDESNQIGGEWDPKTAGNLYVWEDKNGKKFVVNGHHRFQLAKQNKVEAVNAIVDREADGVTAEQARRNGVLINIRDEQGDVQDYADFVRHEKMDQETAEKEGILSREKGKLGYIIGRYSSDNLFAQFKNGDINAARTATIAEIARGDEGLEAAGIRAAKNNMPNGQLSEFLKILKNTPRQKNVQDDLFGFDDSAIQTAEKLSKLAANHIKEVKEKVNSARNAIKNPEAAGKLGVKVRKDAQKLLNEALMEEQRWKNWHTDAELYAQLSREAGISEASGTLEAGNKDKKSSGKFYFNGTFKEFFTSLKGLGQGQSSKFAFGNVSRKIMDFLKSKGIDLKVPYKHVIDNSAVQHILNHHSSEQEKLRGQVPITEDDLAKVNDVVENYDRIGIKEEKGQKRVVYAKKNDDGTTLYVEEIRTGKRELAAVTMYKMKGGIPNDLLPVFSDPEVLNARSDSAIPPSAGNIQSGERDVKSEKAENSGEDWLSGLNERMKIKFPTNTPVLKKTIKTAEQDRVRKLIKEVLGKDVEFFVSDDRNAPDGMRSSEHPDKLFLKADGKYMFTTAWHEFFHSIRGTEEGNRVEKILRNHLDAAAYDRWKEYYKKLLDRSHIDIAQYSEDDLWEEFCCDSLGMLSARDSFWKDLAEKEPGILQKFLNFLRELKEKILKLKLNNPHFDQTKRVITQLDEAERLIAGVLREARTGGTANNEANEANGANEQGAGTDGAARDAGKELPKIGKVWEKNGKKRLYINRKDLSALGLDPELAKYKPFVDLNDPDLKFASLNDKAFDAEAVRKIREAARGENGARTETDRTDKTDLTDERGRQAETRDQKTDSGRFNQGSETPLLSDEEDAGDFQLFAETPKEAAKRDQAAEKAEADKLERAKEEARRKAPELPMKDAGADNTETQGETRNAGNEANRANEANGTQGGTKVESKSVEISGAGQKIEDFGEKIGGARKDIIRTYADKINLKGETFAKMFPKPDYPKLIEAGIKLDALAKLKNAYDSAKQDVKRHKTMSGRQDLRVAQFYAAYAKAALVGEESPDFAAAGYKFTEYGKWHIPFKSRVLEDLFKRLGTEYAGIDLGRFYFEDTWINGKKPEKQDSGYVSANQEDLDKRYRVSSIWGRTGFFDSYDEAFDYYVQEVKAHTTLDKPKYDLVIYRQLAGEHRGEYFIAAKIRGFGAVPLQYFKTPLKDVYEYKDQHADDLQHQAEMMEEQKKAERKGKNNGKGGIRLKFNAETLRDRVGTDYRNGKDVTVQEFAERFGFRGVEFGNYVTQKERQAALNATYDSLLDLASALDVSPRALSLGGRLGFAYGARGSGGAGAHFEPQKNVINLTKTRGAGALAHEWWHALDYYLSGSEEKSATDGVYKDGTREELKKVFEELRKVFLSGKSDYRERAELLDASTGKKYYSTPTELGARAFSDYVTRQLEAKGQVNDFLSSHVSEKDWAGGAETYPYPTGEDAEKIDGALQGLFNTIEEKTDPAGNSILLSPNTDYAIPEQEDFEDALKNVLDAGAKESRYVFKTPRDREAILDGARRFFKEFAHKEIYLSDGRKVYFMPDNRAFSRGDAAAWAEYCIHSVTSSGKTMPGKEFAERIFNHHKLENMDRIEPIIKEENVFGKFNDKDPAKDSVIFTGRAYDGKRMEIITRLDQYGNINADLTEVTVLVTRSKKENPPSRPLTEVVEAVAQHQAAGFSPSTGNNLPGDPAKVKPEIEETDKKSEPDIKLSISGEIGMENLSRESQEGLRRLEDLQTAKRLHKLGGKMDSIKFQTGWELGKDGKWRTELPDLKVKRKGVLPDGVEYQKNGPDFYFDGKLGDYIEAPEIFEAYPELRNLSLDISPSSDGESGGVYYRKSVDLATGDTTGGKIRLEIANPSADLIEGVLVHEVQHAIQDIEGFARGGSPEEFESKTDKLRPLVNAYVKKGNASKKFRRYRKLELDFDKVFESDDADYEAWMEKHGKELQELSSDPEVRALLDERADVAKRFGNSLAVLRVMKYPNDPKAWKAVAVDDESFKEAQYRRLAGEVEARNAERRSKMPLEHRLRQLLSRTEDVAEEDKIYLGKAVGEALSKAGDDVKKEKPADAFKTANGSASPVFSANVSRPVENVKNELSKINDQFNKELEQQIAGELKAGHIYQLGNPSDILLSTGIPDLPIELSASHLFSKAKYYRHPFALSEVKNLPNALQKPIAVFRYGNAEKAQNIIVEIKQGNKNFLVGLHLNQQKNGLTVNSIRGLFPKDFHEWLNWIQQGKALYLDKEKIQTMITQRQMNSADVSHLDLDSIRNIIRDFQNANEKSEKNPENSGNDTDVTDKTDRTDTEQEPDIQLSPVTDPELLKQLEAEEKRGEYLTLYRAAQLRDGKLYSPMAAKINGEWPTPIQLGRWEQADEHPELIVKGDKFKLDKGNGSSITAAYNPYIHSSETPLNDQFSSAYKRPELVTLEVRVPKSELTSGYHAEHAKDSVGMQEWKAGIVSQKLSGRRQVMLSRYDKPVRIVPDREVAQKIKEMLEGTGVSIPENVVTPLLRAELERAGVKIEAAGAKNGSDKPNRTYKTYKAYKDSTRAEKREGEADSAEPDIRFSPATPEAAKEASDEVFGSEKDGIVNRIWEVAKIWKSPVVGEKKDVSAGASVLKNFYYQGRDVPTLGRVFEGGLRIDEFKNQAENYMFNGNSGHDRLAEFAAWQKANKAEYKRLNDYMVKTDMDRKADHVCRVAENSDHKWEVIAGNKKVLGKYGTEVEALEAAFQQEKNGLIADGWKPETSEWVYLIRNIFARQYEILAKDVKETEESLKDSNGEIPAEFVTVFTAIREMGDLRTTYFPRIRKPGKYLVYGTSPDGTEEMRKFDTKEMASIHAGKLKRAGYKVSIVRSNQSSEDVYSDLNVAAMNETLLHAADRLGNPEKLTWESIGFTPGEDHYKENSGKVVDYFTLKGYKSGYAELMEKFGGQWFNGMWRFKRLYRNEKLQQGLLRALTLASGIVQSERDIMTKNIMAQTADVLRMHGSRSHMIKRSGKTGEAVVKGYEEDLLTAMRLSVLSVAGGYGKRNGFQLMMKAFMGTDLSFSDWLKEHAPEMVKNPLEMTADELAELGELHKEYQKEIRERMIDSAKQPHAYKLGMNFIKDMMRNETSLERSMGFFKSIAGLFFLSRPSSGIINLTTMAINVPAVMSDRLGISIPQAWKYINREGKRFLQWKAGKLKPEGVDEYFYRRMVELGFGKAEMNKDVAGTVMTWGGRAWKKTMETGLLCFAKTEEFNRFVTTAAAFRVLLEQERAKLKPGETISNDKLDDLIRKANREVTLNAHGVYGKLGTPDIMRGGGVLQETAKSAYTYKNYQHNTWQMCWDYVCRGKWGQLAYVSGSSAAIAGLKASPAVALAFMVMGMAGGEPPEGYEEAFYRWISKHAGNVPERFARMGLGGFAGADLRGSMGMEIGVNALPRNMEDFLGAPYSFGKGVVKGVGALAEGDFYTASQKLLPSALAAPVRAIDEKVNGIQRRGKPELYEGQPIQPDSVDMVLRMLGFNPAAISEKREKNRTMRSVKNKLTQERSELRNDLRGWYQRGRSRIGYLDIFQKIQRYNELAKRYGEKEFTQKDIERAMK